MPPTVLNDDSNDGPNPEDLPLEDPEDIEEELQHGFDEDWWEKESNATNCEPQGVNEDCALRMDNQRIPDKEALRMVEELEGIVKESFKGRGRKRKSTMDEFTRDRVQLMTSSLRLLGRRNLGLIDASELAADALGKTKTAARNVRRWIREFKQTGQLPPNIHGKWNKSIIEDEDLAIAIKLHLQRIGKYAGPQDVIKFFSTPEGIPFARMIDEPPDVRTAQRWMHAMGYWWGPERHGQYADGHERDDVVEYRQNIFIPQWIELERRMRKWDKDGNVILPELKPGEKIVTAWGHDECTYRGHDRRRTRWNGPDETPALKKKGEGKTMMVADLVSPDHGFLRRDSKDSSGNPEKDAARVIFRAGKERDGFFCNKDLRNQIETSMDIVKENWSEEEHVFFLDNATTHTKLPGDAPVASKMTLGPSKKVLGEKEGPSGEIIKVKLAPAKFADGSNQELYYPDNHPTPRLQGAFKGLAKLLEERGIPGARKMKLVCPDKSCPRAEINCCAQRTMANQPDFKNQKTILQLLAESRGHRVIYFPKFHCELNWIEQCWGMAKRVYRDYPASSSEADLRRNLLASLDAVRLQSIRRFAARSRRFIHAYRAGLNGEQAAWAQKQYSSHRTLTESALALFDTLEL